MGTPRGLVRAESDRQNPMQGVKITVFTGYGS
jgi:hypothetical protein